MDSIRVILSKNGSYYSDECFKKVHLFDKSGNEVQPSKLKSIDHSNFFNYKCEIYGSYVTLEYNQKKISFCNNELFSVVFANLNKIFKGPTKIKIINLKSNKTVKIDEKIIDSIDYEIKIENQFSFKNLNGDRTEIRIDYLSTVSDAKKEIALDTKNGLIRPEEVTICDDNKRDIKDGKRKLISIPNFENVIYYRVEENSKYHSVKADEEISRIAKSCYKISCPITNYLVKKKLFYSEKCMKFKVRITISGNPIDVSNIQNYKKVDESKLGIGKIVGTITIEYNKNKFIFCNDEKISDVNKLFQTVFTDCKNFSILDEKNNKLPPNSQIDKDAKYHFQIEYKFKFKCINEKSSKDDRIINMNYLATVEEARNTLSIFYCGGDNEKIIIYDDNKEEITELSTKLIEIHNYRNQIYFEIDASRGTQLFSRTKNNNKLANHSKPKKPSSPPAKSPVNKNKDYLFKSAKNPSPSKNKFYYPYDDSDDDKKGKSPTYDDDFEPKEIKKSNKRVIIKGPRVTNVQDDTPEKASKLSKEKSTESNLLSINFVFNNDETLYPFMLKLDPETTIEELYDMVKEKRHIKGQIKISHKFQTGFSEIDSSMNLDDVREEMNENGRNYLYIDIMSQKSLKTASRSYSEPYKKRGKVELIRKNKQKSSSDDEDEEAKASPKKKNIKSKKPVIRKTSDDSDDEDIPSKKIKTSNKKKILQSTSSDDDEDIPSKKIKASNKKKILQSTSSDDDEDIPSKKVTISNKKKTLQSTSSDDDDDERIPQKKKKVSSSDDDTEGEENDDDNEYGEPEEFTFKYNKTVKTISLPINTSLIDNELEIKEAFRIPEKSKIDFFDDDEMIEDKDSMMELFINKTIRIEKRKVNKTKKSGIQTYPYKYQTNRDDDEHKVELEATAKVLTMKQEIAEEYDVDNLADIKIIFAGKDLLNNIVLKDLNIGDIMLYVYIRTTDDIILMTARGLRV